MRGNLQISQRNALLYKHASYLSHCRSVARWKRDQRKLGVLPQRSPGVRDEQTEKFPNKRASSVAVWVSGLRSSLTLGGGSLKDSRDIWAAGEYFSFREGSANPRPQATRLYVCSIESNFLLTRLDASLCGW